MIEISDSDFEINSKELGIWFLSEELNDFCNNHPFEIRIPNTEFVYKEITNIREKSPVSKTMVKIASGWSPNPIQITFEDPEHELMFKLIY